MNDRISPLCTLGFAALMLLFQGCSRAPARVNPPSIDAKAAGTAAMEQYDTNKDGKVDPAELAKAPSLKAAIANLDLNGDKVVDADEVTQRIQAWQESKRGLTTVMTTVFVGGRPLAGATVVYEPEEFLGPNVQPATGTTNESGMALMRTEGAEHPGVAPGLYLVRITKDGMNLPAKYNTATVLGVEIATDSEYAKNNQDGPRFNL